MVHNRGRRGAANPYGTGRLVGHAEPFEMPSHRPEPWTRDAACAPDKYPSARFPANGPMRLLEPNDWHQAANSPRTVMARMVCAGCPVRRECGEYAVRKRINNGIWGGLTEKELRALLLKAYKEARAKSFVVIRQRPRGAAS